MCVCVRKRERKRICVFLCIMKFGHVRSCVLKVRVLSYECVRARVWVHSRPEFLRCVDVASGQKSGAMRSLSPRPAEIDIAGAILRKRKKK